MQDKIGRHSWGLPGCGLCVRHLNGNLNIFKLFGKSFSINLLSRGSKQGQQLLWQTDDSHEEGCQEASTMPMPHTHTHLCTHTQTHTLEHFYYSWAHLASPEICSSNFVGRTCGSHFTSELLMIYEYIAHPPTLACSARLYQGVVEAKNEKKGQFHCPLAEKYCKAAERNREN